MTRLLTRTARRLGMVAAVTGLAAGAFVVASSGSASAGPAAVTIDHFLCYQARESGLKPPPNVLLYNEIQPVKFAPNFLGSYSHCNPANKSVPGKIFYAKDPLAHLFCFNIENAFAGLKNVKLTTQFGTAVVDVALPTQFCLPSWKSNIAPPAMTPNTPPGLDHLTCYVVKALAASYGFKIPAVKAEDEFSAPKYTALRLGIADRLCVPTWKIVAGVLTQPQGPNDPSITCFPSSATPFWRVVWDQNQFGTALVAPVKTQQFCVPTLVTLPVGTT